MSRVSQLCPVWTDRIPIVAAVSNARKFGIVARVATRMAAKQAGRNRIVTAFLQGCRVTLESFARVLHLLWLEISGFFFLAFAGIGALALIREYPKYQEGKIGPAKLMAAVCFLLLFAYFGVSSFWRVRKKAAPRA